MTDGWKGYRLVPENVLFFRDGRPSSMGDDHYLRSIFLPHPSTVYGMVRTQRMLDDGCDLSEVSEGWWKGLPADLRAEIGEWGRHGSLMLRGPWLVRDLAGTDEHEILLPAPLDLLVETLSTEAPESIRRVTNVVRLLPPEGPPPGKWSHDLIVLKASAYKNGRWVEPPSEEANDPKPAQGWFLTMKGIESWMSGHVPSPGDFVDSRSLWSVETRTGVGLQPKRRVSQDRMLYTFGFIRLVPGVSIGFELSGGALKLGNHVRLGGENRLALLSDGPSLSASLEREALPEGLTAISLITAGIYDGGSRPEGPVVAAVVSESVRVGGWDLAGRVPKPLWRAVPAGAVYYIDGPVEQLGSLSQKANEGFGLMLRGSRPRR